ncbi:hypothetical protein DFP94_101544 [Fontibacillus phaseoli]|uniref:Uncharacterized protein n=2 Tax=Fontibacillus phaseoli TaxID=1416533 RepID=A0A369BPG2_9BACL|nr:hypothetical protein DFP94_101544 [Fontibacillus phaseoli]
MALVPLKQNVTVTKPGADDGWGGTTPGAVITYKARVSEETNVVTNQYGEEATTSLRIILDKLPDVSYDDVITYTNELGVTVARKPVSIEVKRGLNGKALSTEVFV